MLYQRIKARLHDRNSKSKIAIIYDDDNTIRILPASGKRIQNIEEDFPDSIIGYYTQEVTEKDFIEDVLFYFERMGATID